VKLPLARTLGIKNCDSIRIVGPFEHLAIDYSDLKGENPVILARTNGVSGQFMYGIPVDRDVLLTNHKNVHKKRLAKRRRKLVEKITFLKPFLNENEKVLLVAKGYSPVSTFEKYLIGWFFIYLKRSLFVFTNQRIFHIPTTAVYTYRNTIAQIIYSGCESIAMKGRSLVVEYSKKTKREKFLWISGKERKKITELLKTISLSAPTDESSERTHLCPSCTNSLAKDTYTCESCGLQFKTKITAIILSILFPAGGYLYTRKYFLGFISAIVEIVLLSVMGLSFMNLQNDVGGSIYWFLFSIVALLSEKAVMIVHTSDLIKEFIPKTPPLQPKQ